MIACLENLLRVALINRRWLAIWLGAGLTLSASARELAVGDAIPAFSAKDQFGKEFQVGPGLRWVLVGLDMDAGKAANHQLAGLGAGWLEKRQAAYVLDIHTMPAIARVFALPKMRKYPQRIVLAEDANLMLPFPHQPDKITMLLLAPDGKIREIRYWNPATEALEAKQLDAQ